MCIAGNSEMSKGAQIERRQRPDAKPNRGRRGSQRANSANARSAIEGEGQQKELQLDFGALLGAAKNACNETGIFVDDGGDKIVHLFTARLAPKIVEGFAFDLAGEQRADAGAGETHPDLVNEVGR
jgi:hypothetical protein